MQLDIMHSIEVGDEMLLRTVRKKHGLEQSERRRVLVLAVYDKSKTARVEVISNGLKLHCTFHSLHPIS